MIDDPLAAVLTLLAAAVLVVALARRVGLPAILGYLVVGALLGPHALALTSGSDTTRLLAELGVVFLLFTLGLEFSWPRMVAMRREVFGVGAAQMALTAGVGAVAFALLEVPLLAAIALGGAVAVSSTAIVVQQLTEQVEINRTHGRMAFSVLLFQDLAFVPFLVLAGALASGGTEFTASGIAAAVGAGVLALAVVLLAGRYALRPLLYEIAHSRLRELFTLAVLLVALGSAWVSHLAGVSMATGAWPLAYCCSKISPSCRFSSSRARSLRAAPSSRPRASLPRWVRVCWLSPWYCSPGVMRCVRCSTRSRTVVCASSLPSPCFWSRSVRRGCRTWRAYPWLLGHSLPA